MRLKRESWDGKYRLVARDDKGRLITWKKYSPNTSQKDRQIFKRNRTLDEKVKATRLKNVTEYVDSRGRIPRKGTYQYYIEGRIGDDKVDARSLQHPFNYPKKKAKEEAWENFYYRLDEFYNGTYEKESGRMIFENERANIRISEGVVYYR